MSLCGTYIRSLTFFVVAFLCLNPAAVVCLAYCNSHNVKASATHCPLKKQGAECPHSQKAKTPQNRTAFENDSVKGCVMPVNFIAAPVESKFDTSASVIATASIEQITFAPAVLVRSLLIPKFYYRPPPNDSRFARVRNQVFRI